VDVLRAALVAEAGMTVAGEALGWAWVGEVNWERLLVSKLHDSEAANRTMRGAVNFFFMVFLIVNFYTST
jgi:hypothetical protein